MDTQIIDWSELKLTYLDLLNSKRPFKGQRAIYGEAERWQRDNDSWVGCTGSQMREWIATGYSPPTQAEIDDYTPTSDRRALRASEEGELDFALAWSGDPMPFREWELREQRPGLRIVADMSLHCGTPAKVIADYGAWLAGLCSGLETSGYDLEVSVAFPSRCLMERDKGSPVQGPEYNTVVRVSRENEFNDFTDWSALLSPGGFRMLGFVAYSIHADRIGREVSVYMGYPTKGKWVAEFDSDTRTLHIGTPNGAREFPAEKLTAEIRDHGLIS